MTATGVSNIAPVGTAKLGAGLWGHFDLAGDLSEWVLDQDYPYFDPCTDCSSVNGYNPAIRGGSFADIPSYLLATHDGSYPATNRYEVLGIRCARAPVEGADGGAAADESTRIAADALTIVSADAGPEPSSSCQPGGPGMTNCGPGGIGNESCCTSLEVPGGTYYRTYDGVDDDGGGPVLAADGGPTALADPATAAGFRMDKYLVTVGRFRQCVNYLTGNAGAPPADGSGIHTHVNGGLGLANSGSVGTYETGWDAADWNADLPTGPGAANTWNTNLLMNCDAQPTWTATAGSQENLPMNCVNWYEAYAFCIWDGGFLPSESEWEYVAAGGNQQREYPWGSTDPGTANQYAVYGSYYYDYASSIAPVGTATLGAAYWGQLDMAGEVFEWNLDGYAPPRTSIRAPTAPT
jgi:formylglycine-generating enzyme required for sulfatase activity